MSELVDQFSSLERMPSGIAGLDQVLHGGFLKGRIYLIIGPPGAGKTVLSNQMCFHHVATGGRALYFTLLAETSSRMLSDLQSFTFFTLAPISDTFTYVSGYAALQKDGLNGLINLLRTEVRRLSATLLVIDGAMIASQIAPTALAWKEFLRGLQVSAELLGCTILLLSPQNEAFWSQGEQHLVEGVVELTMHLVDMRSIRELQVSKFRGSAFLEGRHVYTISETGFNVHPRTETVFALPASTFSGSVVLPKQPERLSVGIAGLDEMLYGGLPSSSTTFVLGAGGTGKTLLGSHFLLEGAVQGEKGLYYGFSETPPQLVRKLHSFKLDVSKFLANGLLEVYWNFPIQDHLDILAEQLLDVVKRTGARRLFLDGLSGFQRSVASAERLDHFLTALFTTLRTFEVTVICSVELPELFSPTIELPESVSGAIALAENIVLLRYVDLRSHLYRLISIMKMRESDYDSSIREFQLSNQGIKVASTFASAEGILTGIARMRSEMSEMQDAKLPFDGQTGTGPAPRHNR